MGPGASRQRPHGWLSPIRDLKGMPQTEQNGGSMALRSSLRQSPQRTRLKVAAKGDDRAILCPGRRSGKPVPVGIHSPQWVQVGGKRPASNTRNHLAHPMAIASGIGRKLPPGLFFLPIGRLTAAGPASAAERPRKAPRPKPPTRSGIRSGLSGEWRPNRRSAF